MSRLQGFSLQGFKGWQGFAIAFVMLLAISGCSAFADHATPVPVYVTATFVPTDPPTLTPIAADTSVLGPTSAIAVSWTPLPTGTKTPLPTIPASLTPSFTPEFTETPTPKVKPGTTGSPAPGALNNCGAPQTALLPANGFTTLYQRDPAIQAALGCVQSAPVAISSAVETFDSGAMFWASALADQPHKVIYALYNNGTYQRFDDNWTEGIDPAITGETAPAGRKVPIRGFGKVWHGNPTVHNGLGWATSDEGGTSGQIQRFARGELLYVASTNQIYVLAAGSWHADPTHF